VIIRRATPNDATEIAAIYAEYVRDTIVTFETQVVSPEAMAERIREKLAGHEWLVATIADRIVGYAYFGSFRPRVAYAHTVESTIYLSREAIGKGIGRALYAMLIDSARALGFREMLGVIALPNPASVRLHEALGFRRAGLLSRVGSKFGRSIDVGLWQRSLE